MHIKSVSALAFFALAAHATASEPMPYKPLAKMSIHRMFGIGRRQDSTGYQPTQSVCGSGDTCAEACGSGYEACTSTDDVVHCYDPTAQQTCCPDGTGNSCDDGYYCSADTSGETWCCPSSMTVEECATAYGVTGGLVSETPTPTPTPTPSTTPSPSSTPSSVFTSFSVNTTSTYSHYSYTASKNVTTEIISTNTTICPATGVSASATHVKTGALTTAAGATTTTGATSASTSSVSTSGANVAGPAGILALIAAVGAAALL